VNSARAFRAVERSTAVFVALAVQVAAVAVVGDVFSVASRADAGLPPLTEVIARAAPAARGERLMTINLAFDLMPVSAPANVQAGTEPPAVTSSEPAAEGEPAPEAAPPLVAEPAPQPRPDPTPAPPPPPPAPPTSAPIAASLTTQQSELRMLALMNESRLRDGLVPLTIDGRASDAARLHSAAEARVRYVYHDGPDGTAASRNVPACGTGWYGENTGKVWSGGVDVLHREFMSEPWAPINHRTNIMDPNFRRVGVGAVEGPDAVYITMVFCR
jgi:uncharacterized protein YkwD